MRFNILLLLIALIVGLVGASEMAAKSEARSESGRPFGYRGLRRSFGHGFGVPYYPYAEPIAYPEPIVYPEPIAYPYTYGYPPYGIV